MTPAEIAAEQRRGRLAGFAALGAALLFPAGVIWSGVVNSDSPERNKPAQLRFFDQHAEALVGATALRSLGFLLLIVVALHLYRATKARNPGLSRISVVIGVLGPAVLAIGTLGQGIYLAFASSDFVAREFQTIEAAEDVATAPVSLIMVGLSIAGTLALAFWFVVGSLDAMRAGLLSRFVGIVGIVLGPAFVLNVPATLIVPIWLLWLLAIGALFLAFWPRGLPPAWEAGEARPWPSAAERREAVEEAGGSRDGNVEAVGPGVRSAGAEGVSTPSRSRGGGRKKRKRRR